MRVRWPVMVFVLGLVALVILNIPAPMTQPLRVATREFLAPYQTGITRLLRSIGDFFGSLRHWKEIQAERDRLAGEIALLNNEIHRLELQTRENAELRRALDYTRQPRMPLIAAEVIAREDSGGWWHTVRLNRGSSRGVSAGGTVSSSA